MLKVGQSAHTSHGIGEITDVDTVRGSTSYKVAGPGFSVWVDATKITAAHTPEMEYLAGLESTVDPGRPYHVNEDNHTTLPYDPSPQYHVDIFRHEQTIQPGHHEIDPDKRLHSSDSLNKNKRQPNRPYPGPNPDLFAREGYRYADALGDGAPDKLLTTDDIAGMGHTNPAWAGPQVGEEPMAGGGSSSSDPTIIKPGAVYYGEFEETDPERPEWGDDEWHEDLPEVKRTFGKDAGFHEDPMHSQYGVGSPGLIHPVQLEYDNPGSPDSVVTLKRQEDQNYSPGEGRHYRPAGLSDRYAHIIEAEDNSEVGQFRADPLGYIQRYAHVMISGEEPYLEQKFADYTNLLDVDPHLRTAAWADVRDKAKWLRAEGRVHPEDIGPNRIMAKVDGENGTYKTLVLRGPDYAGIGKGANSATFSCDCPWGKWAFKRKFTFVGRMCSHALATLWTLQSEAHKGNPGKFKSGSVVDDFKKWAKDNNDGHMDQSSISDFANTADDKLSREDVQKLYDYLATHHQEAPERDYDIPYTFDNDKAYKTADILRTQPLSLTPDLREVPQNDEHEWTDVTEDDRKTTGPDQIVHFSKILAALHPRTAFGPPGPTLNPDGTPMGTPGNHNTGLFGPSHDAPQPTPDDGWAAKVLGDDPSNAGATGLGDGGDLSVGDYLKSAPNPQGGTGVETLGDTKNQPLSLTDYLHPQQSTSIGTAGETKTAPGGGVSSPAAPTGQSLLDKSGIDPNSLNGEMQRNTLGEGNSGKNTGAGAGPNGTLGTGEGYGGAGFQSGGDWAKSNETTKINTGPNATYTVKPGDTLNDIAQRSGLSVNDIAQHNSISDPNTIDSGQQLKLPGATSGTSQPSTAISPAVPKPVQPPAPPAPIAPSSTGVPKPQSSAQPSGAPTSGAPATIARPPGVGGTNNPAYNSLPNAALNLIPGGAFLRGLMPQASRIEDTGDAARDLDDLRDLSEDNNHPHHMDSYNDHVRDLVEELHDAGVDASPIVASHYHQAISQSRRNDDEDPTDGNANFLGVSSPNWADGPAQGSGPDPRSYISDSQSYLDAHQPDLHDVTDDQDIIKFNDSRSRPQQGPRHSSTTVKRAGGGPKGHVRVDGGLRGKRETLQHSAGTLPEADDMNVLSPPEEPDPLATNDIVANFQRSAAAQDLWSNSSSGGGMFSDDDIAAHAQSMLRTAGRKFTPQEQRELEEEAHHMGARNLPNNDDLAGTHYLMGI